MPTFVRRPAAVLAPMLVAAAALAAGAEAPPKRSGAAACLTGDAARMYAFVKTPHPGELGWQRVPWLTDLGDAIRRAKAERRPLVLFVSGDDPLEKC